MQLTRYLSNRSQELIVEKQRLGPGLFREAEIGALEWVFTAYLFVFKVFFTPVVFVKYLLTNLHILEIPEPSIELLRAQQSQAEAAQAERKNKKAKKLGFESTPKPNEYN